jgi:hypothetical protein
MSRHSTALWWDNECPILNSRNVHTFDCSPGTPPLLALGLDPTQPDFTFFLVKSDLDGNLPIATPRALARVHLPMPVLLTALSRSNFHQRVTLNIQIGERQESYSGKLTLLLNHRVVPPGALGRTSSSLEKLMLRPVNGVEGGQAVSEVKVARGVQVLTHLDKILHLADDLPTLRSTHEIFLFCSVTTPQVSLLASLLSGLFYSPPSLCLSSCSVDASHRKSLSFHHSHSPVPPLDRLGSPLHSVVVLTGPLPVGSPGVVPQPLALLQTSVALRKED